MSNIHEYSIGDRQHRTAVFVRVPLNVTDEYRERATRFVDSLNRDSLIDETGDNVIAGTIKADVFSVLPNGSLISGLHFEDETSSVSNEVLTDIATEAGYTASAIFSFTGNDNHGYQEFLDSLVTELRYLESQDDVTV